MSSFQLLIFTLWTIEGRVDPDAGKKLMRKKLAEETNVDTIYALSQRVQLNNDLAVEVMLAEGQDGPLRKQWNERIAGDLWDVLIDRVVTSLHSSREVSDVQVGKLIGYVTGGMSGGEDPTDVWALWNTVLEDSDPDFGNPYSEECYAAMGFLRTAEVIPPADWVPPALTVQKIAQQAGVVDYHGR